MMAQQPTDFRVLVLAPTGRDYELTRSVLARHSIEAEHCESLHGACHALDVGAGAFLVAEEALGQDHALVAWLQQQQPWSDLPILLLARPGEESNRIAELAQRLRNVTIVQRPARLAALVSTVQSALRARARQYQLREHLAELERTEERLRLNDRRKDEFLAILAHELRNPLAPLSNALHILKLTEYADPQIVSVGEMMERQVDNLKRLVDELLEVSRVTRGDVDLRTERVELSVVVKAAVETSLPLIEQSRHFLESDLPDEPIYLEADPVRLGQVISNLLNNASKYTPPGGRITLRVLREGSDAVISVADDGVGIPSDALSNIFDLFMQVPQNLSRAQGGLGIGLTLAKRLVELHHGSIAAWSEGPGKGSRFAVRLPIIEPLSKAPPTASVSRPESLDGLRVLIADDNCDVADSLGILLEQMGASTCVTYSGAAAIESLSSGDFDVGVIDLGMADVDGFEVAQSIRAHPQVKGIKLVALTGWGQEQDRAATRKAGFDVHLVKPVSLSKLLECLRPSTQ